MSHPFVKSSETGVGNSPTDSTALLNGGVRQVSIFGQEYSCLMLWFISPSVNVFKKRLDQVWTEVFPHLHH